MRSGASSVSVNRAFLPFSKNVEAVRKLTAIAHGCGAAVEARLEGNGPEDETDASSLTSPSGALRLIRETNADCLAISIHTPDASGLMQIDFDRLFRIRQAVGAYPLTLHGALGIPAKQLQKACHAGIAKVNFSKDIKIAAAQAVKTDEMENVFALAKNGIKERLSELILLCGSDRKGTY
ncbi:MAG: class II fructose-bisphosphate aldolase [Eubacteriales bacterium]|nr:class II fructose-bisphosphate aldolase [Eubacteriales bacterium]